MVVFSQTPEREKKKCPGRPAEGAVSGPLGLDWDLTPLWLLPNPSPVYHVYHVSAAAPPPPSLVVRWLRGRTGQRWGRDYHCLEEAVEFSPSSPRPRPSPNRSPRTRPSLPATFKLSAGTPPWKQLTCGNRKTRQYVGQEKMKEVQDVKLKKKHLILTESAFWWESHVPGSPSVLL